MYRNAATVDGLPLGHLLMSGQLGRFESQGLPLLIIQDPNADSLEDTPDTPAIPYNTGKVKGYLNANAMVIELAKTFRNEYRDNIIVGRDPDCDIVISDKSVSRHHAILRNLMPHVIPGLWAVCDADSTNGTRVKQTKVRSRQEVLLPFGAEISFGNIKALFLDSEGAYHLLSEAFSQVQEASRAFRLSQVCEAHNTTLRLINPLAKRGDGTWGHVVV